jgi:hypothetical protein
MNDSSIKQGKLYYFFSQLNIKTYRAVIAAHDLIKNHGISDMIHKPV